MKPAIIPAARRLPEQPIPKGPVLSLRYERRFA
jgi:hypothetical protein